MVLGIGLDLVDVETIERAFRLDSSCAKGWCTEAEIFSLGPRASDPKTLAGRVAAKEAVVKALGTGFAGVVAWQDVEIVPLASGAVTVRLSGGAKVAADSLRSARVLVSITHTERAAGACAIALGH